jgi:hypothetical protein
MLHDLVLGHADRSSARWGATARLATMMEARKIGGVVSAEGDYTLIATSEDAKTESRASTSSNLPD